MPTISESFLQPLDRVDDLEQLLGLVHLEPQVGAGDIREFSRLVYGVEDEENVRRNHPSHGDHLLHLLLDVAHERFRLEGDLGDERLFHGLYPHQKCRPFLNIFLDVRLLDPLDENLYPAVGKAEHTHDLGNHAHRIDSSREGVLIGEVLLGRNEMSLSFDRDFSTAFIDISLPRKSGRVTAGYMTMSRTGSRGSTSGTFNVSSSIIYFFASIYDRKNALKARYASYISSLLDISKGECMVRIGAPCL